MDRYVIEKRQGYYKGVCYYFLVDTGLVEVVCISDREYLIDKILEAVKDDEAFRRALKKNSAGKGDLLYFCHEPTWRDKQQVISLTADVLLPYYHHF
jgi:hypothetical protein